MSSPFFSNWMPKRLNTSGIRPKCWYSTSFIVMEDCVIAAIPMKLPTSIMSGSNLWVQPFKVSTPSMVKRLEPIPCILAPIAFSILHSCNRYGSQAALKIVVVPFAIQHGDGVVATGGLPHRAGDRRVLIYGRS